LIDSMVQPIRGEMTLAPRYEVIVVLVVLRNPFGSHFKAMDPLKVPYFHFTQVFKLLTFDFPVQICDSNCTHFLKSSHTGVAVGSIDP